MLHLSVLKLVRCAILHRLGKEGKIASAWCPHWVSWGWKVSAELQGVQFPEKIRKATAQALQGKPGFGFVLFFSPPLIYEKLLRSISKEII